MKNILDKIKENSTIILSVGIVALIGYILLRGDNPISKASGFGVESSDFVGYWVSKTDSNSAMEITKIDGSRYQVTGNVSGIFTVSGGNLEHESERVSYLEADKVFIPTKSIIEKVDETLYYHIGNDAGFFYIRSKKPVTSDVAETNTDVMVIEEPVEEVFTVTPEMIKSDLLQYGLNEVLYICDGDGFDSKRFDFDGDTNRKLSIKTLEQIKNLNITKTNQTDKFIETLFSIEIAFNDESGKNFKGNFAHRMKREYVNWQYEKIIFIDCIKEKKEVVNDSEEKL